MFQLKIVYATEYGLLIKKLDTFLLKLEVVNI